MAYKTRIGLEIHIQPETESKMFCRCPNEFNPGEPNKNICEICTGQPGTLPAVNEVAVRAIVKAGMALNCSINRRAHWDRKHYFYPDLPKGYQLTQNTTPFCIGGFLDVDYEDKTGAKKIKRVEINRIHLEEDAGKDLHPAGANYSLIDLNRAGAPLIELVTEPVIESKEQATAFCKSLRQIFRYLNISAADMEKGQMRCEVNISLEEEGKDLSGVKVEVKNINSFKGVLKSIAYEEDRQKELLEKGEKIVPETRGWDADAGVTISQRAKEEAYDYRYFPDPDIPPVNINDELFLEIKNSLSELPGEKKKRFCADYKIPELLANDLVLEKSAAEFFENIVSEIDSFLKDEKKLKQELRDRTIILAANYFSTEVFRLAAMSGIDFSEFKMTSENFAELMLIIAKGEINSSAAQKILKEMFSSGGDPSQIIERDNLKIEKDSGLVLEKVKEVLLENSAAKSDYLSGKEKALQFLLGQVMAKTKGKAEPKEALEMLKKEMVQ
jgi:aspartyl-tRNA(Asn)/glutamyl-tRNA(Gln) amidotransferase subunit B